MNKHFLFIQPTIYDSLGRLHKKHRTPLYFVGLAGPLLAAQTPPDWTFDICIETIEDIPWDTEADVIGIGGMGHAMVRGLEICREFKRRGKTVIFGGYMASLVPKEVLKCADCVVIGDVELVWPELLQDLEAGTLHDQYTQRLTTLSTPLPRYDLITSKKIGDFLPVQAGRGCPNFCSFCSIYCLYRGQYLYRDVDEVVRDIAEVKRLGFNKFLLLDDNIASNPDFLFALCKKIRPLKMKWMSQCELKVADNPKLLAAMAESGCFTLGFGLESISQGNLNDFHKAWMRPTKYLEKLRIIQEAGIDTATEMMIGGDHDTEESLLETIEFINKSGIFAPKFYILTPIPGTDFHRSMESEGRIINPDPFTYSPVRCVIQPKHLTPERLEELLWVLYEGVYSIHAILRRNLTGRWWKRGVRRTAFNIFVNLYYRHQIRRRIPPIIV